MLADRARRTTVDACGRSQQHLVDQIAGLGDTDIARPSLLAGWTVGHVLTHLARNADAFTTMLRAAGAGRVAAMYPGGHDGRDADIESGARRDAASIIADVTSSGRALQAEMTTATPGAWEGHGIGLRGTPIPCAAIPASRWREVEVHHSDLGLGYNPAQWPDAFVEAELPGALQALPGRLTSPQGRAAVLGWLWGRAAAPDPSELGAWEPSRPLRQP